MEYTALDKIPKDFSDLKSKGVFNPLDERFTCKFAGNEVGLDAGEIAIFPEHVANHIAKHLADKILRVKNVEFLQQKFQGLDDNSREKWRVNDQHLVTRNDLMAVKEALLFVPNLKGTPPKVVMPNTKFDPLLDQIKGKENAEKAATEAKAKAEQEEAEAEAKKKAKEEAEAEKKAEAEQKKKDIETKKAEAEAKKKAESGK